MVILGVIFDVVTLKYANYLHVFKICYFLNTCIMIKPLAR